MFSGAGRAVDEIELGMEMRTSFSSQDLPSLAR